MYPCPPLSRLAAFLFVPDVCMHENCLHSRSLARSQLPDTSAVIQSGTARAVQFTRHMSAVRPHHH